MIIDQQKIDEMSQKASSFITKRMDQSGLPMEKIYYDNCKKNLLLFVRCLEILVKKLEKVYDLTISTELAQNFTLDLRNNGIRFQLNVSRCGSEPEEGRSLTIFVRSAMLCSSSLEQFYKRPELEIGSGVTLGIRNKYADDIYNLTDNLKNYHKSGYYNFEDVFKFILEIWS